MNSEYIILVFVRYHKKTLLYNLKSAPPLLPHNHPLHIKVRHASNLFQRLTLVDEAATCSKPVHKTFLVISFALAAWVAVS